VTLNDDFYIRHVSEKKVLGPVLDLLCRTVPRDNLVGSACLDLFGHIIKEAGIKDLIKHLVMSYREKIVALSSIDTFRDILARYDQTQGYTVNVDTYYLESEDEAGRRPPNAGRGLMEHLAVDPAQEEYWNCSDDEEENMPSKGLNHTATTNGATPKMLVEYNSDEEAEENGDTVMASIGPEAADEGAKENEDPSTPRESQGSQVAVSPPERLSEKRQREQEDEDEMDRLMLHKRRNSSSTSINSLGNATAMRRKKSLVSGRDPSPNGPKRIAISISPGIKATGGKTPPNGDGGS
jgi:protein phosphatase-4 regulatory subunit 3